MAISPENLPLAREALRQEIVSPNNLKFYLGLIQKQKFVPVETLALKQELLLTPKEAWGIITEWLEETGSNLSLPERGSITFKADKLLESLEYKQETVRTAAATRAALQSRVADDTKELPLPEFNSFQKALASQNDFYKAYNDNLLNPLTNRLADSPLLSYLSPGLRRVVASQLAANWPNYLRAGARNELTLGKDIDEISHLIIHSATQERNNLAHLIHSGEGEKHLLNILSTIDTEVAAKYQSNGKLDAEKALADAAKFAAFSVAGSSLSGVSSQILGVKIAGVDSKSQALLDKAIRQQIVKAAKGEHVSGTEIIKRALDSLDVAKLPGGTDNYDLLNSSLQPLSQTIEATQITVRAKYLGSGFFEGSNTRLLATDFIAEAAGIDPYTPWVKLKEIKAAEAALQKKYQSTQSIEDLLQAEYGKGKGADPLKINELSDWIDLKTNHDLYREARTGGAYSVFQETFSKGIANFQSTQASYDRLHNKIFDKIMVVDDTIRYPQRKIAEYLYGLKEKIVIPVGKSRIPIFNLSGFLIDKWIGVQKNLALGIYRYARSGPRFGSAFWNGVATYSKAFHHGDASFARANFYLLEKGWGNILNWSARKIAGGAGVTTWTGLKAHLGGQLWAGFSKMAPGLAQKFAGTAVQKLVTTLGFASLSGGTSLLLQVGLMAIGGIFGGIIRFFKDRKFRTDFINRIPLMIGGMGAALMAAPAAILAAIAGTVPALLGFLGIVLTGLAAIFLQALLWVGIGIASIMILYQLFVTTTNLDSGIVQLASNILCDEGGSGGGNPNVNAGVCIAKVLAGCGINPLNNSNANSPKWQCALASFVAPSAMEALKRSASSYDVLQCVGLIAAIDILNGGNGQFTDAKNLDTIVPTGYRFASGVGSCSPGDFFVDKNGDWGHTGVFVSNAGPYIRCIDANGGGPGIVRDDKSCVWPTSRIAGCLKKN